MDIVKRAWNLCRSQTEFQRDIWRTGDSTGEEENTDAADEDLSKLTVAELKQRCTDAGLATSGKKADLIERLSNA